MFDPKTHVKFYHPTLGECYQIKNIPYICKKCKDAFVWPAISYCIPQCPTCGYLFESDEKMKK